MELLTISTPATDRFIGALCNTLVHSLWQGLILAALTGLIVLLTRKSSAAMRYNLLIAALTLFAVGVGVTFAVQMNQAEVVMTNTVSFTNAEPLINTAVAPAVVVQAAPMATKNFTESLFDYLNNHHDSIVSIWFLIICAKSIQLIVGLLGVRRLKYTKVHQTSAAWYNHLQQLADKLSIKKSIALLESGLAKVPMVIGTFKPVILIPIGLLTALSTEEVEAILVHELAHIKRRDYLVNLLQSLMEIVFFFNPAVLWISQVIKTERENCCDDLALEQSSNKISYIRALVSCEEYQASVPVYVVAFSGNKNNLMSRVKRLIENRNHTLNLFEKTALAICLVACGLCMSAYAEKDNIKRAAHEVVKAIQHIKNNALSSEKVVAKDNIKVSDSLQIKEGGLTAEVPTVPAVSPKADTDTSTNINSKLKRIKTNYKHRLDSLNGGLKPTSTRLDPLNHIKQLEDSAETYRGPYNEAHSATIRIMTNEMSKDGLVVVGPHNNNIFHITETEFVINGVKQPEDVRKKYWAIIHQPYQDSARLKINRISNAASHMRGDKMREEMIKDGLWKNQKGYSFSINEKEFIVNGVKQPEEVHKKYLAIALPQDDATKLSDGTVIDPKINVNKKVNVNTNTKVNVNIDTNISTTKSVVNMNLPSSSHYVAPKPYAPRTQLSTSNSTFSKTLSTTAKPSPSPSPDSTKRIKIKVEPKFDISDALYKAHLIKDKSNYKMSITNKEMVVNGIKQPESVHQTFLKYYQKKPNDHIEITESVSN